MKFPFNVLGRPLANEVVSKEEDWSVMLTEGGYAVVNPNLEWATRPIYEYLRMKGECGRLEDGTLRFRLYDPPEADYPLYELLVLPVSFLPPDFYARLKQHVPPWEQPLELPGGVSGDFPMLTKSQSETLARVPDAFLAHQQKIGGGPQGFPKLPAAPPKLGVARFMSGGSDDDSPK